jgi:hypothetical protein
MKQTGSNPSALALAATFIIIAAAIGLRIWKAAFTGIIYDEAGTVLDFGRGYYYAWTHYQNPNNNHLINSLLVNFCLRHFWSLEHCFRIHTVIFGILYCLSAAYLAWNLVSNYLMRVCLTALLVFQWFVFDLSFLARGYSIALAAIYGGLAVLVHAIKHPGERSAVWLPIIVLVAVNVLALGSMISAMAMVAAVNICYIGSFSHYPSAGRMGRLNSAVLHLATVSVFSGALLYLLYYHIWRQILAARERFGMTTLADHLKEVLLASMFSPLSASGPLAYVVFLAFVLVALAYLAGIVLRRAGGGAYLSGIRAAWPFTLPQSFILCTMLGTLLAVFAWRNILGLSLGYARNGVFLIPVWLLSCAIIVETAAGRVRPSLRPACTAMVAALLGVMAIAARPSPYAVQVSNWALQSLSAPLLRHLKSIDPDKDWCIYVTERAHKLRPSFLYYSARGYRIGAHSDQWDVRILHSLDDAGDAVFYRRDLFDAFESRVALSPSVVARYHIPAASFSRAEKQNQLL